MTRTDLNTAREIDAELAAAYADAYRLEDDLERTAGDLLRTAGADFYYRGRRRVTDMTLAEALEILAAELARHEPDAEYGFVSTSRGTHVGQLRRSLARRDAALDERAAVSERIAELEGRYTGWSRYFLVTSSAGHVHASMHCSTCRLTTRFGWLPALSGADEAAAVDELGPTLCTVCFPSAPVEYTVGKKLTAAQAAKVAA